MPGGFSIQNAAGSQTLDLLCESPAADTGQCAIPVRVISQLGAGTGGGGSTGGLTDVELRAAPVPVSGTVAVSNLPATQPVSGSVSVSNLPATQPISGSVGVSNFPATQPVSGTFWPTTQPVSLQAADKAVSVTGAASVAVTATLPAPGAGLFHYITRINIIAYASAARTGAATPTVVTSTNLPGSLAWTTPTAAAIGTQYETDIQLSGPLKSSTANVATTIVAPATSSVIWRINVVYYAGP